MPAASYSGEIAALVTALMWVLCSLAFTAAGRHVGSLSVNFIRLVIAFVFFAAAGLIFRGQLLPLDASGRTWMWLSISGAIGFFFGDLCLFKAFLLIGPRLTLLVCSLVPPMTALLAVPVLGEKLDPLDWVAMAVTLAGVTWVVLERRSVPEPTSVAGDGPPPVRPESVITRHKLQGVLLALGGAVGQASGVVVAKYGLDGYDSFAAAHIRLISGTICFAVLITLLGRWDRVWTAVRHTRAMALLTFGALTGPFIGVSIQLFAIAHTEAGIATTLMATSPVLILPFVIVLHKEKVSLRAWLGAAVAIAGIVLLCYDAIFQKAG